MQWIYEPWPWYFGGAMIALIIFLLIMMDKNFGMSSNLRTLCTICGAGKKVDFFKFNWKTQRWNLIFVLGTIIGGFIAANYLSNNIAVDISKKTIENLNHLGFKSAGNSYLPDELFMLNQLNIKSILLLIVGGILVGFGARYAGGCTSGHAISGLSNLQLPSLIAVVGFFIGGLIMVHLLFPLLF